MVNSIDKESTSKPKSINERLQPAIAELNESLKKDMATEDHLDQNGWNITIGDPCSFFDEEDGAIHLLLETNHIANDRDQIGNFFLNLSSNLPGHRRWKEFDNDEDRKQQFWLHNKACSEKKRTMTQWAFFDDIALAITTAGYTLEDFTTQEVTDNQLAKIYFVLRDMGYTHYDITG